MKCLCQDWEDKKQEKAAFFFSDKIGDKKIRRRICQLLFRERVEGTGMEKR